MPNILDADGIQTQSREDLIAWFQAKYIEIYGPDIDVSSSSPDGQQIAIFVQTIVDLEDLLVQIYNSFNPNTAIGTQLDQRVAINNIQRQSGTYTETPILVTVSQALTLYGLDQDSQPVYTVADNEGNNWLLKETQTPAGPGSDTYTFRAENQGRVLTVPNTITVPVTIVLGVTSVNNPSTYSVLGQNEETDAALRIRQQQSTQIRSQGFYNAITAALANVTGVTSVNVYENYTDTVDANGVPGHSIWVVLTGTGDPEEIANAIYAGRTAGCGMVGSVTFNVLQQDGTYFTIYWDNATSEALPIKFTATSIDGVNAPKLAQILAGLPSIFVPGVAQEVNINQMATLVQQIDPNTLVTDAGFPVATTATPSTKAKYFVVQQANIYITPPVLLPSTVTLQVSQTQQFTPYGGSQAGWTYSLTQNETGGSIDVDGLYTAGATPGTDIVQAEDGDGNTCTATVTAV